MTIKIAIIGAGSKGFTQKIVMDILSYPALRKDTLFSLMDINETRLKYILGQCNLYKEDNANELAGVKFETTTDQQVAIKDAKYVISVFMVGGPEAYKVDIDIPYKYGVSQCVGDTLSPGAVFRFLRNVPVYTSIIENMKKYGYNAGETKGGRPILLNYSNPMAMNTWFCNHLWSDSTVGLCHGVQHSSTLLQLYVGATADEMTFDAAGINHMCWFYDVKYKDSYDPNGKWINAYPRIWQNVKEEPQIIGGEKLRWDMMKATGFWMTESCGHLSEYLPYYRKRKDLLEKFAGAEWGFPSLKHGVDVTNFERDSKEMDRKASDDEPLHHKLKVTKSEEYVSGIVNAMETNIPFKFFGNVINKKGGLITNLPADCCVEVPIMTDFHGLHPTGGIELPSVCAGLCSSNIHVQKCAVEGAITKDPEKIYHALLLDPNSASVCSPEEIRAMTDELFAAEKKWLTWFNKM